MLTVRGRYRSPGTLAEKRRAMPSSGCTRTIRVLGAAAPSPKSACGSLRNWIAISVTRLGSRLPLRK